MEDMSIKVDMEVKVTAEDISDLMVTALEGGIGYWAQLDNSGDEWKKANRPEGECISETAGRLLLEGKTVRLIDEEEEETHELTLDKLLKGIAKWFMDGNDNYGVIAAGELDMCQCDSDCADGIIQTAIFGEIVYG